MYFRQIVILFLQQEASANIIDNKGCQPLYWAAWNGHAEICQDLLSTGPSFANVNEQVIIVNLKTAAIIRMDMVLDMDMVF